MAAHLHRYTSELRSIEDTIAMIVQSHRLVLGRRDDVPSQAFERVETGLRQITSQVKAIKDFEDELEKKVQTSLALVRYSAPISELSC